ncbi:DNA repair and recombination RAD26-like protein [Trifolium pratense]|uniref:DNA repair and recombination RAD26-like protein n=1 Tax=Trifolium pratense TaxID=57577 RepID=A0A2K3NTF2_TRIPR|nr:DNA repair and recombination RAD26-like protein [Trifolium pratense]
MSLQTLKETLRHCTTQQSQPSSSSSSSQSIHDFDSHFPIHRKPPKSSLAQQLRLLDYPDDPPFQPHNFPSQQNDSKTQQQNLEEEEEDDDDDDDEEPEIKRVKFSSAKSSQFQFDHTGPFEPLVLSSDGELPLVQVPASINCRLLEHQRVGVKFLYDLYKNNHGGILGDDMGLGKTIQTIAFLAAIFGKEGDSVQTEKRVEKRDPVLIICPSSIIQNWESEFSKWSNFSVSIYHGANRDLVYDKLEANGVEVLITSFDTFRIYGNSSLSDIHWNIVIIDEAHRLKNWKSKLYNACLKFKTLRRYGLTGTVMQNKILELFNIFDLVAPGSLGTREHFREFYDEPLKHGQRSTAPDRRMIQLPDIQCLINKDRPCSCGSPLTQAECCKRTVPDGAIWPYLHKDNLEDGCDSCPFCIVLPCLIKLQQISNHLELIKPNPRDDPEKQVKDAKFAAAVYGPDIDLVGGSMQNESFLSLSDTKHCGKMRALEKLLLSWFSNGNKVLLFSYSVRIIESFLFSIASRPQLYLLVSRMLNILEKFIIRKGYCFSRLDGSTPTNLRQSLVDDFNSSPSKQVFLISTRAGGLGLNLVSANRVVIFDPNWNPSQDLQAQDRSFRFGQKRHVVVFRLLSAGSLEELIYSRQVYKQQLSNIAVSGKMEKRYFEGVQDCKEFKGELFGICNLFRDLSDKLFTSEIIEMHETSIKDDRHKTEQQEKINISEETSLLDTEPETRLCSEAARTTTSKPDIEFEDLGIVYAHRNEDVVNSRPVIQGQLSTSDTPSSDDLSRTSISVVHQKEKPDCVPKKLKVTLIDERKRAQFSLLADSMGMGELAFSKWLLSATPEERKKVLIDYKKKKTKV